MRLRISKVAVISLATAVLLQGCVNTTHQKITRLSADGRTSKVVLMPVDVTLGHLTTGGAFEIQAEWTARGEANVRKSVSAFLEKQNAGFVEYRKPTEAERDALHTQLVKLHRVVGASILTFQYQGPAQLPTKKDGFDWSLGPDMKDIGRLSEADYALFVHMKDSYATAGRVAIMIIAALLNAPVQGGQQVGFASLVDLKSGDVVWFNALVRGEGDLREEAPAASAVEMLLANFPK